jgi:8-oxo-dGTP pyrophosphatase MutT (NUDIX family)
MVAADQLVWRPAAYAVVMMNGKLLVSARSGGYDLPGGGIELGETPEAAVVRETKEETGITVNHPRLIAVDNVFFKFTAIKDNFHCLMLYYLCDFVDGELSDFGFDDWERQHTQMPEWYPLEKLGILTADSSVDFRKYVKQAMAMRGRA